MTLYCKQSYRGQNYLIFAKKTMLYLLYKARERKRQSSSVAAKPRFLKVGLMPVV